MPKNNFNSIRQMIPTLIGKAIEYLDHQVEKSADKTSVALTPKNIDQVYLNRINQTLPVMMKSQSQKEEGIIRRKSYETDLQSTVTDQGYKDRNTALSFDTLNRMAMRDSIVSAIIVTRTNQISNFSRPSADVYQMGFEVVPKNHNVEITKDQKEKCYKLEQWLLNTGYKDDRVTNEKMNFEEFLRRIVPDTLIYDPVAIEIVPCEDGTPHHFLPVSSGTIRLASSQFKNFANMAISPEAYGAEFYARPDDLKTDIEDVKYLQLYRGLVIEVFGENELIYRQRNPTNEPSTNGYSIPELERLVGIVSSHVYAETHNKQFFTGGFTAPGLLHFKGDIPQEQMDGFRRSWETQVTGANNSFRTPIIATEEEVNWLPISVSNKDMEWNSWISYLIKIMCAIYQIDPSEINFWDLSQGQGSSLNEGNRNETIIKQSRDKGLRPMLRFIESIINDELFVRLGSEVSEHFEFRFVGLESEERMEEVERHNIEVKSKKTVNQVRRESHLPPLPYMDNMMLDPIYFQWWQSYSPEAIELKIKNAYLEKILVKKYDAKLKSLFPDEMLPNEEKQSMQEASTAQPEDKEYKNSEDLKRSKNDLVKVEYIHIN